MELYDIIKALQSASGSLAKQAIMDEHKGNALFKAYMKAVYDPAINYYQKKVPEAPEWSSSRTHGLNEQWIQELTDNLALRSVTGAKASTYLGWYNHVMNTHSRELLGYIIDRKIGANVGTTMVLKTWPDLFFTVPYQRCSLVDDKAKARIEGLEEIIVQTKADGSFAYVVRYRDGTPAVITRAGTKYPQEFAETMAKGLPPGWVVMGELLVGVVEDSPEMGKVTRMLPRKEANGILNSVLKDGDKLEQGEYEVSMVCWDVINQDDFIRGKSDEKYHVRLEALEWLLMTFPLPHMTIIPTWTVKTLAEAYAIYTDHTSRGLEGCIASDPDSIWKDGTAKDKWKMKLKFEVEMLVTGLYEGEGKAKGMLGGVYLESEDGGIQNACGSGFNDAQRRLYWEQPHLLDGRVVAIEANDITQSRDDRKKPSLSLPIFVEVRYDKASADTTERIYAQLEAAKMGGMA